VPIGSEKDAVLAGNKFFSVEIIKNIITDSSYWHLWYLYSYIGLILTMPFLRKMVLCIDEKDAVCIFTIAVVLLGILPIIDCFSGIIINNNLRPNWVTYNIFIYPVLGYALDKLVNITKVNRIHIVLMWCVSLLCFVVDVICEHYYLLREPESCYNEMFLSNFCMINASVIFITVKYMLNEKVLNKALYNVISQISMCTYGIYLLHILVLWKIPFFYNIWIMIEQNRPFGDYFGVFISCIAVFCICLMFTWILRKIPIIKKLL
jgi:surface polysaccharide O-acyltransferase-like enzyme